MHMTDTEQKVVMSALAKRGDKTSPAKASRKSPARKLNHLQDEVYREMMLLEGGRPGSEMGLALALLRAVVQCGSFRDQSDFAEWLKMICPLGLSMIEVSLGESSKCSLNVR